MTRSLRTVIIPAAGRGTRLLPATRVTAKELLPVYDRVLIDFAMQDALQAGAERIIVVISRSKTAIRDYLSGDTAYSEPESARRRIGVDDPHPAAMPEVVYVYQDRPLGLGHAVLCCANLALPGPIGVILPDDVIMGTECLSEMAGRYTRGQMVAAMQVGADETSQYGIFRLRGLPIDRCIAVSGMVEKPKAGTAPSSMAAVGRYILDPAIFDALGQTLVGAGGEVQLTDAISIATKSLPLTAFRFSGMRFDCGNHDGLLAASQARQVIAMAEAIARNRSGAHAGAAQNARELI
ncbi:MAG: UTP--glucose-1-phosphate uridylyltransferase [Paracoccaceae bacterium]